MERPLNAHLQGLAQRAKQVLGYGRHLARLTASRRFRALMLTGQLPGSELALKILYLGHTEYICPVRDYFFDGKYQAEDLGPAPAFLQDSVRARLLRPNMDAVVTASLPGAKKRDPSAYEIATLRTVVHLPNTMDAFQSGLPYSLRWSAKHEFETESGATPADYAEFHERMLKPLLIERHGPKANIAPLNYLLRQAGHTTLIFVKYQGRRVGGCLLRWPRMMDVYTLPHADKVGIVSEMNRDSKRLNQVNLAIYHSLYRLAWERGFRAVSLGTVSPVLNSGLVRFKARWRASFHAGSHAFDFYRHSVSFCSGKRHAIQSYRHLIHLQNGQLVATVGVRENHSAGSQVEEHQKDAHIHNLRRLYRTYPDGRVEVRVVE